MKYVSLELLQLVNQNVMYVNQLKCVGVYVIAASQLELCVKLSACFIQCRKLPTLNWLLTVEVMKA